MAQAVCRPEISALVPLALFALIRIVLFTTASHGALYAAIGGFAFWFSLLGWATVAVDHVDPGLVVAASVIALLESAYFAAFGWACAQLARAPLWIAAPAAGSMWAFGELVRSIGAWGMPYGELGASLAYAPAGDLLALTGAPALSAVIAAACYAVARLLRRSSTIQIAGTAAGAAVIALACASSGVPPVGWVPAPGAAAPAAIIVQDRSGTASRLEIYPEGYADPDRASDASLRTLGSRAAGVVVGAVHRTREGYTNEAVFVAPSGTVQRYAKQRLVPFGEFVPLERVFSHVVALPHDGFVRGDGVVVWNAGPTAFGPLVCFEIGFTELVRTLVARGGQFVVVPLNDAWFGNAQGLSLQLAVAAARSRSFGTDVVIVPTRSPARVLHPDGSWSTVRAGTDALRVGPRRPTAYAELGDAPLIAFACTSIALAVLVLTGRMPKRAAVRGQSAATPQLEI